jgi:hypothetical protein
VSAKIGLDVLDSHLQCKTKAHLMLAGERGDIHEYEAVRNAARGHVGDSARTRLLARHPDEDAPAEGDDVPDEHREALWRCHDAWKVLGLNDPNGTHVSVEGDPRSLD